MFMRALRSTHLRCQIFDRVQAIPKQFLSTTFVLYENPKPKSKRNFKQNDEIVHKINKPTIEQSALFASSDPDTFGTLNQAETFTGQQTTEEEDLVAMDPGDRVEQEYITHTPMKSQNLGTTKYANMVKQHLKLGQVQEAIDVLEVRMLKDDRVKPDPFIYNLLINACARRGYTQKAFNLYNRMKQRSLKVRPCTYTALFNACAESPFKADALKRANKLRQWIVQNDYIANEANYNAMIKAYGRCGDISTAFQLVDEMKERKLQLKSDTVNFLLQACINDKALGFRHALLSWHRLFAHKLTPDVYSFNLMLRCTRDCGIGDIETMRSVIAQLLNRKQPKHKLLASAKHEVIEIKALEPKSPRNTEVKSIESGEVGHEPTEAVEVCMRNERVDEMPNLITENPHLGSLVQLNLVKSPAERFLLLGGIDVYLREMEKLQVKPDIKTFTAMLDVIPQAKEDEHKLIQLMRRHEIRADVDFFNVLMKRRCLRGDDDGARDVLKIIEAARLEPDIVTYGILSLACADIQKANELLERMKNLNVKLNIEILGALLKRAAYSDDYDYFLRILHIVRDEKIKLSPKFLEIISKFMMFNFSRRKQLPADEQHEFETFLAKFKKWKKAVNLGGVNIEEAIKAARENPWKQFKERQTEGAEPLKNSRKTLMKKNKHKLHKLTESRLKRIDERSDEISAEPNADK